MGSLSLSHLNKLGQGNPQPSSPTNLHLCDCCSDVFEKISYIPYPQTVFTEEKLFRKGNRGPRILLTLVKLCFIQVIGCRWVSSLQHVLVANRTRETGFLENHGAVSSDLVIGLKHALNEEHS